MTPTDIARRLRQLTREEIEKAVEGVEPGAIQDLAVGVKGTWYPVKQPVTLASRVSHKDVNSRRAWRVLRRRGFPLHDTKVDGPLPSVPGARRAADDTEIRKLALSLAAKVNRGKAVSAETVVGMAETFEAWLRGR